MKNIGNFDLNLLIVFQAVYEERSIGVAAKRIGLAQPSASNALARLRMALKDPLFVRAANEMQPTAFAESIAPDVAAALRAVKNIVAKNDAFDPYTSAFDLKVATTDYFEFVFLPVIAQAFHQEAPKASLRTSPFSAKDVVKDLDEGAIDLAIGATAPSETRFRSVSLGWERLVAICRPDHPLSSSGLDLETFLETPQILFSLRGDGVGMIDALLSKRGLSRNIAVTTSSLLGMARLVSETDLLAVTTERLCSKLKRDATFDVLPLPLPDDRYLFKASWRKGGEKTAECAWFADLLKTALPY